MESVVLIESFKTHTPDAEGVYSFHNVFYFSPIHLLLINLYPISCGCQVNHFNRKLITLVVRS